MTWQLAATLRMGCSDRKQNVKTNHRNPFRVLASYCENKRHRSSVYRC